MNNKKMEYYPKDKVFPDNLNFIALKKNIDASSFHPFHWHDYFELELVLSGRAEHRLNNTTEILAPGSAYLLSYFDSHALRALSPMEIFSVRFDENMLSPELTRLLLLQGGNCRCFFDDDELSYINQRIDRIMGESRTEELYGPMLNAIITEIILLVIRKSGINISSCSPNLVQKAQLYIVRHFRENITLKLVARELSVTPKYLGAVFKDSTKICFNDYLNNLRLKYACNLLRTSDLSVKEIAFSSGYSSAEYFLDIFKRKLGTTPTLYRKTKGL
ncbi:MAG: helix-turn-helix transcriptional regulator [Clostridia bacterium]|nr:helix-turn-helix transcriptional regulator [Clostridia bacterium]